jgi:hypothetical protein
MRLNKGKNNFKLSSIIGQHPNAENYIPDKLRVGYG